MSHGVTTVTATLWHLAFFCKKNRNRKIEKKEIGKKNDISLRIDSVCILRSHFNFDIS